MLIGIVQPHGCFGGPIAGWLQVLPSPLWCLCLHWSGLTHSLSPDCLLSEEGLRGESPLPCSALHSSSWK